MKYFQVILLLLLIQDGVLSLTSLLAKVCALSTGKLLSLSLPRKSAVRLTERFDMTIAVDWDVKPQTKQNKNIFTTSGIAFINERNYPLMLISCGSLCSFNVKISIKNFSV